MVLSMQEFVQSLQNEVRIVLHLAGKVDRAKLDYRPTPKQRSTIELLRYISMMGPILIRYTTAVTQDPQWWPEAEAAANARDFDQAVAAIAAQKDLYPQLLANVTDASLRETVTGIDGNPTTRGAIFVNGILCGCTAYRMQLFLYLKASGREDLTTMDVWAGMDQPAAS